MQTAILQILVLITHGNAILSNQSLTDIYPGHDVFQFDEFVKFVDLERVGDAWSEHLFADDPNAWLAKLKELRCTGLKAERISLERKSFSDRMAVAFVGGGGRWLIKTVCPSGTDYWEAKWEIGDRTRSDQKLWRITYGRIARNQPTRDSKAISVDSLSAELDQTLHEAILFSKKHKLDSFGGAFEAGRLALRSSSEPDLQGVALEGQLPLAASRLLAASQASWVFGGMGSWNDLNFDGEDQKQYETISDSLFRVINSSLVVVVNTSFPKTKKPWWGFWQ